MVVAWPIVNELYQSMARAAARRFHAIEEIADHAYDVNVGALIPPPHIVGLAHTSARQNENERPRMILDEQPIANIHAIAVDR